MIIGITGTLGAGKGTIVEFLKTKGFKHYSVRAYLTEEILRRKLTVNRDSLVLVANELRAKYSPSYIAEQLYNQAKKEKSDAVIESLRTEGEVMALREKGEFYLFAVDAEPKVRYERIVERASETDKIDFKTFVENEKREMQSKDPTKQNIKRCMELADHRFINNSSIEELYKKVEEVLRCLQK